MMSDFSHVEHKLTRAVLLGVFTKTCSILDAAWYSAECQSQDYKCELLEDYVINARESAISDMWYFIDNGNESAAIQAMRRFWTI
jgi:hypothetical protein